MDPILQAAVFFRSLFLQACWNYERMQNLGFAWCMKPWIEKLYPKGPMGAERRAAAMRRHLEFFNTQPYMAGFVLGVVGAMEEELRDAPEDEQDARAARIAAAKKSFSSALAGVGDAFFWGTLRPLCAALGLLAWLALWTADVAHPVAWSLLIYLAAANVPALWARWGGIELGYELGEGVAVELKRLRLQDRMRALRWAGLGMAGALTLAALLVPPWGANPAWVNALILAACGFGKMKGFNTPRLYGAALAAGFLAAFMGF